MRNILKKIGKSFVGLRQITENDIRQSVLLVDGSFILPNNFALIIRGVRQKFKNAKIVVLTFREKKDFLKKNFPDIELVVPKTIFKLRKHRLAWQLLILLIKRRFRFVVLSSLDISLLVISLLLNPASLLLHNRWLEWYRIRPRTILDLLKRVKSTDINRRKYNRGLKDVVKSLGRIFVVFQYVKDKDITSRVLLEDNRHSELGYVLTALRRAEEIIINPDITILTFHSRKEHFKNIPNSVKTVILDDSSNRLGLAYNIYRMRKNRFNFILLTSLDISPVAVSFFFFQARIMLYNKFHQWWSLRLKNIFDYLVEFTRLIMIIPLYVYLFAAGGSIILLVKLRLLFARRNPASNRGTDEIGYDAN